MGIVIATDQNPSAIWSGSGVRPFRKLSNCFRLVGSKQALLLLIAADSVGRLWRYCQRNPIVGGSRSERAARALRLAFDHVAKQPRLGHAMAQVIFGGVESDQAALLESADPHHGLTDIVRAAIESDGLPLNERAEDIILLWRVVWGALSMWLSELISYDKAVEMIDLACAEIDLD